LRDKRVRCGRVKSEDGIEPSFLYLISVIMQPN
jgi:hypothetical protein